MRLGRLLTAALLLAGLAFTACDDGEEQQQEQCPSERICTGAVACCPQGTQCKPVCQGTQCTPQCVSP